MTVEILDNQQEDLIQESLAELKEQSDIIAWQVKYIKESKDKKYNIYAYKLVQGGTKWGIKNKYVNQIWARIEWTQFTDAWWREITKDRFNAWEIVYLRVPKKESWANQTETENIPGKVQFVRNSKDKENKDWKIYKYTFVEWGTLGWVEDKIQEQIHVWTENFYDKDWNKLPRRIFKKWETVYAKIPNTDVINPAPEMTINEIMNLSDNDINWICDDYASLTKSPNRHTDKNWRFIIVNNKKIYERWGGNNYISNRTYISIEAHETITNIYNISIRRKEWNNISWIFYEPDGWEYDTPYRWKLEISREGLAFPEWYWDRWK